MISNKNIENQLNLAWIVLDNVGSGRYSFCDGTVKLFEKKVITLNEEFDSGVFEAIDLFARMTLLLDEANKKMVENRITSRSGYVKPRKKKFWLFKNENY